MTIPSMQWCGVGHPHGPHTWMAPAGMTGWIHSCPGPASGSDAIGTQERNADLATASSRISVLESRLAQVRALADQERTSYWKVIGILSEIRAVLDGSTTDEAEND